MLIHIALLKVVNYQYNFHCAFYLPSLTLSTRFKEGVLTTMCISACATQAISHSHFVDSMFIKWRRQGNPDLCDFWNKDTLTAHNTSAYKQCVFLDKRKSIFKNHSSILSVVKVTGWIIHYSTIKYITIISTTETHALGLPTRLK